MDGWDGNWLDCDEALRRNGVTPAIIAAQNTILNESLKSEFTGKTLDGKTVSLADFKGKTVVLEWYNPGCPFVKKFYEIGRASCRERVSSPV